MFVGVMEWLEKAWNGPFGESLHKIWEPRVTRGRQSCHCSQADVVSRRSETNSICPCIRAFPAPDAGGLDVAPNVGRRSENGFRSLPVEQVRAGPRAHAAAGRRNHVIRFCFLVRHDAYVLRMDCRQLHDVRGIRHHSPPEPAAARASRTARAIRCRRRLLDCAPVASSKLANANKIKPFSFGIIFVEDWFRSGKFKVRCWCGQNAPAPCSRNLHRQ